MGDGGPLQALFVVVVKQSCQSFVYEYMSVYMCMYSIGALDEDSAHSSGRACDCVAGQSARLGTSAL